MATRRDVLLLIGAAGLPFLAGHAAAAEPTIELLAMGHWPVQSALKPVREVLAKYDGRVKVVDLDIESPDGERRAKAVGLKGHIPIVILIAGSKSFKRADGKTIEFVNFPASAGNPMGLNGTWSVADFEVALRAALGEKAD
ncbi:MAG: hypothetical protein HXX10_17960 [Rhodoplanes sp.]|uniref:hypothetical protein n=1 Tax=Rhodoplanes sp. TaxID=1968906 RepID=UPI0017FDBB50|nr:hypothetical protein [Rhodoplanes sp.]NVO15922.1 hypothetical protein [Rhodoplanes sp.]